MHPEVDHIEGQERRADAERSYGPPRGTVTATDGVHRALLMREVGVIQLIDGAPEGVLAFELVGEVDAEDYEDVLKPAVEESLDGGNKLRFVVEIGAEFDRFTAGAEWQDMTLGFSHLGDWQRCALVTDVDWVEHAAKALGWLMGGRLQLFPIDELKAALEWAASDE